MEFDNMIEIAENGVEMIKTLFLRIFFMTFLHLFLTALHSEWSDTVHDTVHVANATLWTEYAVDEWSIRDARSSDECEQCKWFVPRTKWR